MRRLLFGTLLALGLAVLGFGLGGLLAAELLTSPGDGLAGGATVSVFALGAAFAGAVAGLLLALRLAPSTLPRATAAALLLGAAAMGLAFWRGTERREAQAAKLRPAAPVLGPDGKPLPPPLPPPGTRDALLGLVTVPPESLPRFETKEHGYEEESVTVYGQEGNWYLVGLRDGGRAWLHTHDTGRYLPLEELVVNRLNWLTEAWDTRIRQTPDLNAPAAEVPVSRADSREIPANVVEARRTGDRLWLKVEVLERSPCEGGTPPVIASGWIPAWDQAGKPTAWFYSRGC